MAQMDFTFDLTHGDALLTQIDGRALIEDGKYVEILLKDLNTGELVTVSGWMEDRVKEFLRADDHYAAKFRELCEDDRAGQATYYREIAFDLRRAA